MKGEYMIKKVEKVDKFDKRHNCAICGIQVSYGFQYMRVHFCGKHNLSNYVDSKGNIIDIDAYNKCKSILDSMYNPYQL